MKAPLAALVALLPLMAASSHLRAQSRFELVQEIGVELGPEEYSFGSVAGVALSAAGELFVLDGMAKTVRVFDHNGRYRRAFGREGSGPGEFQLPGRILIVGAEVWVFDPRLQRLTVFSEAGEVIRTTRVPESLGPVDLAAPLRGGIWLGIKTVSSVGSELVQEIFRASSAERADRFAHWRRTNESLLVALRTGQQTGPDTLFRWDPGGIPFFGEGGFPFGFLSRNWGSGGSWTLGGDTILVTLNQFDGTLSVWRVLDGRLRRIRSGRVPVAPAPITEEDVERLKAAERRRRSNGLPRNVLLVPPRWKAQLGSPIVSTDGSVWIPRVAHDPTGPPEPPARSYLIVPLDGGAQQQVLLPPGFRLLLVTGDTLVGTRRTENDVQIVQLWRRRK